MKTKICLVLIAAVSMFGAAACDDEGDGEADADVDTDADADADADITDDPDGDIDGDGDAESEHDADSAADADFIADADDRDADPDTDPDLDPDRLHQDIEHLTNGALMDALYTRVEGHVSLGYDAARIAIFTELDVRGGSIECIYTGLLTTPDGTSHPGTFNTEHSWPRADGADTEPAESDLHHLFPTDADANNRRGSYEFGETACTGGSCPWAQGGSELGVVEGGSQQVFQVRREHRGDIARAHFYFSIRYELSIPAREEGYLRTWHVEDPPSDVEETRNEEIEGFQSNRNPFVDRPDFVHRISDF